MFADLFPLTMCTFAFQIPRLAYLQKCVYITLCSVAFQRTCIMVDEDRVGSMSMLLSQYLSSEEKQLLLVG